MTGWRFAPTLTALTALMVVSSCGNGVGGDDAATPTATLSFEERLIFGEAPSGTEPSPTVPTTEPPQPPPGITTAVSPPVEVDNLCDLMMFEVTEAVVGELVSAEFAVGSSPTDLTQPGDSYCLHETESGALVRIASGRPTDFEPGASLEGSTGEQIPGVGDGAVWFTGPPGVLSVRDGHAYFRVVLQLPNRDSTEQLEIAKALATTAIERLHLEPVPPVEVMLCDLVTDEQAEEILGPQRSGRPAALTEILVLGPDAPVDLTASGDQFCTKLILAEIYVKVEQGSPGDLDEGAHLAGVVGEPLSGVAEAAVWFPGVSVEDPFAGPHETGVLSIRQGNAHFRIVLSLPDVASDVQLEIARGLAASAVERLP